MHRRQAIWKRWGWRYHVTAVPVVLTLCIHPSVLPCPLLQSLCPLLCPFLHSELSCAAWAGSLLQQEEKEGDFDRTHHFLPPAGPLFPFPHKTWQKSSRSRSVVSGNLWFLGREQRRWKSFPLPFSTAASVVRPITLDLQQDQSDRTLQKWPPVLEMY